MMTLLVLHVVQVFLHRLLEQLIAIRAGSLIS
jgi:hypothetical protein